MKNVGWYEWCQKYHVGRLYPTTSLLYLHVHWWHLIIPILVAPNIMMVGLILFPFYSHDIPLGYVLHDFPEMNSKKRCPIHCISMIFPSNISIKHSWWKWCWNGMIPPKGGLFPWYSPTCPNDFPNAFPNEGIFWRYSPWIPMITVKNPWYPAW